MCRKMALRTTLSSTGYRLLRQAQNAPVVAICAKIEAELSEMDDADRLEFLQELGQSEPGLNRLIRCRLQPVGPANLFHGRRERGAAPGPSASATPAHKPPA
jgi:ribosome-binding ATPase YchF (GTP1/OBG family)